MKIVVFADSHTDVDTMNIVTESECPDMVIHLGDSVKDAAELQKLHCNIPMEFVKGNTDKMVCGPKVCGSTENYPSEKIIVINNTKIFLTHGDEYDVEADLEAVINKGLSNEAEIILFGHTHKPFLCNQTGIWIMNPGRIGRRSSKHINATYGVIIIEDGIINCKIAEFDAM